MKQVLIIIMIIALFFVISCTPTKYYNNVLPEENYPLDTRTSVSSFENAIFDFTCDQEGYVYNDWYQNYDFTPDQHGLIGIKSPGVYLMPLECSKILETGNKRVAYRLFFDPNNGFVYQSYCDNELMEGSCPTDFDLGEKANPDYEYYLSLE